MRLTLEEQEKTQTEQDQLLEAKLEESERFVAGKVGRMAMILPPILL